MSLLMIKVDISNVWGQVSLPELLSLEKEVICFCRGDCLLEEDGRDCITVASEQLGSSSFVSS